MKSPGYPLPDGVLGSDDIVCQLVYLPNKPEYWQALLGALSYMTTWKAWERDSDKRGKDAAANWREAFELTMECWRMTCLTELEEDVAAILAIMQNAVPCCDDIDVTGGDQYTDRVEDGVGNVPQNIVDAGYASSTSDWAGFDDYKCMIAHVLVDQMTARLTELAPYVETAGLVIGGLATVAAIVTTIWTGGLTAIAFGVIASTGATALLYQSLFSGDLLDILSAKVTTNHDALVCSVYQSDGDDGALVALNDTIDDLFTTAESLILKNMNLGPTLKALYAGRYDQQDIADTLLDAGYELGDFSCDCDVLADSIVEYDMNPWIGQWNVGAGTYSNPDEEIYMASSAHPQTLWVQKSGNQINTDFSLGYATMYLRKITFKYMFYDMLSGWEHVSSAYMRLYGTADGQSAELLWSQSFDGTPVKNVFYEVSLQGSELGNMETVIMADNTIALQFRGYIANIHAGTIGFRWDDIKLYLDEA